MGVNFLFLFVFIDMLNYLIDFFILVGFSVIISDDYEIIYDLI